MKILHLIQKPQHRGAETFTCQLAKHHKNLGMQVKIAGIFKGDADLNWDDELINLGGNPKSRFIDYKAWRNLNHLIQDFQPDIIQANAGDTLKYAIFSKKIFGWKTPIVFRNASEVGRYLRSVLQKRFNSYLYRNLVGIVSVSKASEKDILHHFPFLEGKTRVIPVGLEEIIPNPINFSSKEKKHIVHVGGFSFEKNHKGLLYIFKAVLKANPDTHLHLIGDGNLKPEIEKLVIMQKLQKKVTFYGFVQNPLDYIKAADVIVLPSIIEGLPGVLLEAMYCETPVVAYNVGGIPEIVNSSTGILVEKNNEKQFATGVISTLDQPDLSKVKNAWQMVKTEFLNKKLALEFLEFYKELKK